MSNRLAARIAFVVCASLISGCTSVAPWERGNLAKPQMALVTNPARSAARDHVFTSREAASGGASAAGGGCGCN